MNIVCVGAHPDDEMGCLGTLIRYRAAGSHQLGLIIVTNGDRGMSWDVETTPAQAAEIRAGEMQAVAESLGAELVNLGEPDELLTPNDNVLLRLVDALRSQAAELVFTHPTHDYNRDHEVTAQLVLHAALLAHIASIQTDHRALRRPPAILHMHPGEGYGFEATHFVELSRDVMEEKLRLIRLHESQMAVTRQMRGLDYADLALEEASRQGRRILVDYAEAFRPCLAERRIPLASMLP